MMNQLEFLESTWNLSIALEKLHVSGVIAFGFASH